MDNATHALIAAIVVFIAILIVANIVYLWTIKRRKRYARQEKERELKSNIVKKLSESTLNSVVSAAGVEPDIEELSSTGTFSLLSMVESHIEGMRYEEAEAWVIRAVNSAPKNIELKVKLAEIYFNQAKVKKFLNLAGELQHELPRDGVLWKKVSAMVKALASTHPLSNRKPVK